MLDVGGGFAWINISLVAGGCGVSGDIIVHHCPL